MRAVERQNPEPMIAVAEKHQIFAEQPDFNRPTLRGDVLGKTDRPPVASQHLAGWCSRANSGQQFIFFV
jgi:hypothetical protein